jgi:hypothetical protein
MQNFYHFSIDDVFDSLIEATDSHIALFEHPFFAFLHSLHANYASSIDLYLFYQKTVQGKQRRLSEVSSHLKKDFMKAKWLRLGPHALDYDTAPYVQSIEAQKKTFNAIYKEIDRFAGPDNRSQWLRLHYFSEAYELANYWQSQGVDTLLLTDKPAVAYRLPSKEREQLAKEGFIKYQRLNLRSSHERMENLVTEAISEPELQTRLASHLEKHNCLILFSHEIDMGEANVQAVTHRSLSYVSKNLGIGCIIQQHKHGC